MEEEQGQETFQKEEQCSLKYNELPQLSILTPTWNRKKFLPLMIANVTEFTYDKNKLEWFIMDDHPTNPLLNSEIEINELKEKIKPIKLKYVYDPKKHLTIGEKRNRLMKECTHKNFSFMDDDDVYMSQYLLYQQHMLKKYNAKICGSNAMLFIFPNKDYQMSALRCSSIRQVHEATLASSKKYVRSMGGFIKSSQGEGSKLIDFNEKACVNLDIQNCMICVGHETNTISKDDWVKNKIEARLHQDDTKLKILKEIFNN